MEGNIVPYNKDSFNFKEALEEIILKGNSQPRQMKFYTSKEVMDIITAKTPEEKAAAEKQFKDSCFESTRRRLDQVNKSMPLEDLKVYLRLEGLYKWAAGYSMNRTWAIDTEGFDTKGYEGVYFYVSYIEYGKVKGWAIWIDYANDDYDREYVKIGDGIPAADVIPMINKTIEDLVQN